MVNKREKNEGAKKTAATTAPKPRTAAKPKATTRTAGPVPAAKVATKPGKKKPAKPESAKPVAIRDEDVALRAYFIAEKRQRLGLPGDSLSDWVEAERELLGERVTHGVN